MEFHPFQELPIELRQLIWECSLHEHLVIDAPRPVCRIITPGNKFGHPKHPPKLVTHEYYALGHVCRESRDVLHRSGLINSSRGYVPATDVLFIDDYDAWRGLEHTTMRGIYHLALSSEFCYDLLKKSNHSARRSIAWNSHFLLQQAPFFLDVLMACPELKSTSVIFPSLEEDMPFFADHFPPLANRPSFLKAVPYSETKNIRIRGPYTYGSWLRGGANTKRKYLGSFIKDVNEVWRQTLNCNQGNNDPRRSIKVQAGVLQCLEEPFKVPE
ncbi:hypothetical protein J7T55_013785 [Diaporthe amygdali]|uniref:uncharacterized protein n=1 Tax=Phomopsis amygdali TaxID=1214568 RepID=UPI0022FE94C0|nr:uncharacterized protein J7T55_013785 [Diaporthe amygdali]KAJ0119582.1 hypothetical protein J7T55_013785 [Diaporthe amygdali]